MPLFPPASGGGGAWELVSYQTASADDITISGLDLVTDLNYKVIIETKEGASDAPDVFKLTVNGITTASYSWTYSGRKYDGGAGTSSSTTGSGASQTSLSFLTDSINSMGAELNLHVGKVGSDTRIFGDYRATGLGDSANNFNIQEVSGCFYSESQANVTSLELTSGAGVKAWKVWVLKPATA